MSLFPFCLGLLRFGRRLVPLLATVFFLAIAWFDLGDGVNVPALLWYEDSPKNQLISGLSITLLFGYIWLVTYVLDIRCDSGWIVEAVRAQAEWRTRLEKLWKNPLPTPVPSNWGFVHTMRVTAQARLRAIGLAVCGGFGAALLWVMGWIAPLPRSANELCPEEAALPWYLSVTFLVATLLLAAAAVFREAFPWWFVLGILVALLVIRVFAWGSNFLYTLTWRRAPAPPGPTGDGEGVGSPSSTGGSPANPSRAADGERWLRRMARVLFLGLLVAYLFLGVALYQSDEAAETLPPIPSVCILFAVLVGFAGLAWYQFGDGAVVFFGLLLVWMAYCNHPSYKLRLPGLQREYEELAAYVGGGPGPLDLPEWESVVRLRDEEVPVTDIGSFVAADDDARRKQQEYETKRVRRLIQKLYLQSEMPIPPEVNDKPLSQMDEKELLDYHQALLDWYGRVLKDIYELEDVRIKRWAEQMTREKLATPDGPRLVVVTATGGANRSALWTASVLGELEKAEGLGPNFPKHVLIITGASGGMVGAAHYVASLKREGRETFEPKRVAADYLTPIINRTVFREVPLLLVPTEWYSRDRGHALEVAMERQVGALSQSFRDLKKGEDEFWRPSLIFSPMLIEDGRRLLISNRNLSYLASSRGSFLLPENSPRRMAAQKIGVVQQPAIEMFSVSALEMFRLFPEARCRFRVSTAARMNASFPFLSPAVDLPTEPPRRVIDAGYYDTYGVNLAAAWLYAHRETIAHYAGGVVVIQMRDSASHDARRKLDPRPKSELNRRDEPGWFGATVPWLTGPITGAGSARDAVSTFRNDEQLQILSDYFADAAEAAGKSRENFFRTVVFERRDTEKVQVGMNWYLTDDDKNDVLAGWNADHNKPSLMKLTEWWHRP